MKDFLKKLKKKLEGFIFDNIQLYDGTALYCINKSGLQRSPKLTAKILIVSSNSFLRLEKTYKVMSKTDLTKIIEHEVIDNVPFKDSYILHQMHDSNNGAWQVSYSFLDLSRDKVVHKVPFVFLWEDVVLNYVERQKNTPFIVSSDIGNYLIEKISNRLSISSMGDSSSYKAKTIVNGLSGEPSYVELNSKEYGAAIYKYCLSLKWLQSHGSFNRNYARAIFKQLSSNTKWIKFAGISLAVYAVFQIIFLMSVDHYYEFMKKRSEEPRRQFVQAQTEYKQKFEQYENLQNLISTKTTIHMIPEILSNIPSDVKLTLTRFDYIQGLVNINGEANDIEKLTDYLTANPKIQNLDFISPIVPSKNSFKFAIQFEYSHD